MKLERKIDSILIDGRYQMYKDGCVYDTLKAQDIPSWIFEFRDFLLGGQPSVTPNKSMNEFLLEIFKQWYDEAAAQRAEQLSKIKIIIKDNY